MNNNILIIRANRKTLRLSLRRDGTPVVYAPKRYPKAEIDKFVDKNLPKLTASAERSVEQKYQTVFGNTEHPTLMYMGVRYPLIKSHGAFFTFTGKEFRCSDTMTNDSLLNVYREFLRLHTKELLPVLAKECAEKNGLSYNIITIKNIYSRFGSCSGKKNLNFSLAMSAFRREFIVSVVAHELAHTVHMDHSPDFHRFHNSICPEAAMITSSEYKDCSALLIAICSL